MRKNIKDLTPAFATHPGEILKDELKARKLKQKDFANMIGIEPSQLNEILHGKRHFSTWLALLTEAVLQIDAQLWINLRNNYELDTLKQDKDFQEHLDGVRKNCVRAKGGDD